MPRRHQHFGGSLALQLEPCISLGELHFGGSPRIHAGEGALQRSGKSLASKHAL